MMMNEIIHAKTGVWNIISALQGCPMLHGVGMGGLEREAYQHRHLPLTLPCSSDPGDHSGCCPVSPRKGD